MVNTIKDKKIKKKKKSSHSSKKHFTTLYSQIKRIPLGYQVLPGHHYDFSDSKQTNSNK
jgi:hypothetical protein